MENISRKLQKTLKQIGKASILALILNRFGIGIRLYMKFNIENRRKYARFTYYGVFFSAHIGSLMLVFSLVCYAKVLPVSRIISLSPRYDFYTLNPVLES